MSCGCDKGFCSSYMLLKPEEVGLFNLFHILYSPNLQNKSYLECGENGSTSGSNVEDTFRHRCLILISILTQKLLQFVAKPLASLGSSLEFYFNLVSFNNTFFNLLLNFLTGKGVMPDKTSAKYLSFIGNLDKRVELDGSIKHQDNFKYNAALSAMASKASYENPAYLQTTVTHHWKMEFEGSYDYWNDYQGKATTQAFIAIDKSEELDRETYVVSFRGTEPFDADAWCSDFDISWYEIPGMGKIHGGFMKALGLQKNLGWPKQIPAHHPPFAYYAIRDLLRHRLGANNKAKFLLTGHSQGGALAILFAAILMLHQETLLLERLEGIYTFGQPRVGDQAFATYMDQKLKHHGIRYCRFVYCNDIVTRLPYDDKDLMFKHFGTCYYYNRRYEAKIVKEEPNKNYFSPLAVIPMMVNALFELIRSFTIVYKNGGDYQEGWLLRLIRLFGLLITGLPAHSPQDYVNATRLASLASHPYH